jgi:hypothetical protein
MCGPQVRFCESWGRETSPGYSTQVRRATRATGPQLLSGLASSRPPSPTVGTVAKTNDPMLLIEIDLRDFSGMEERWLGLHGKIEGGLRIGGDEYRSLGHPVSGDFGSYKPRRCDFADLGKFHAGSDALQDRANTVKPIGKVSARSKKSD